MSKEAKVFLEKWHKFVESGSEDLLDELIAEDAMISSPAYYKPKQSKTYVMAILRSVFDGFEDFRYTKEWVDGRELILEFETRIGETNMKGIDRITINADSQITHIEVLIRPLNALIALAEHIKSDLSKAAAE